MSAGLSTNDAQSDGDWDVIVVGAGAAGLMASAVAALRGRRTLLLEKNRKPGVKILMSGGTRCNLTHNTDASGIISAFGSQGKFLYSALAALSPHGLVSFFNSIGVPTKVESTGKVFPSSDRALDVQRALVDHAREAGVDLRLESSVNSIGASDNERWEITLVGGQRLACRSLIITVGGQSYPGCGTTGDGFAWARQLGHEINEPRPALTPLIVNRDWVRDLSGVTLSRVAVDVVAIDALVPPNSNGRNRFDSGHLEKNRKQSLAHSDGGFLFTHFGVSGPVPMNVSHIATGPHHKGPLGMLCDWLPQESPEETGRALLELSRHHGRTTLAHALAEKLPKRLNEHLLDEVGIDPTNRMAELGKSQRVQVIGMLHSFLLPIDGTKGFAKAEVTAGGIALNEVSSSTMASKLHRGLYFAGEVLDLDGPIGGYNFQSAFSTGNLAGLHA